MSEGDKAKMTNVKVVRRGAKKSVMRDRGLDERTEGISASGRPAAACAFGHTRVLSSASKPRIASHLHSYPHSFRPFQRELGPCTGNRNGRYFQCYRPTPVFPWNPQMRNPVGPSRPTSKNISAFGRCRRKSTHKELFEPVRVCAGFEVTSLLLGD